MHKNRFGFSLHFCPFRRGDQTVTSCSRLIQRQVPPCNLPVHSQPPTFISQSSPYHFSDPATPQYQDWNQRDQEKDRENPLTRLEIALAEVQGFTSPDHVSSARNHDNSNFSDRTQGPTRSLSVLEKVSCFEHRERSEKQHSQNTSNSHNKTVHPQVTQNP